MTNEILYFGLWQSMEQIESGLENLSVPQQVKAFKAQIRFRDKVFNQKCKDQEVMKFSKVVNGKRVAKSVEEFKLSVTTLVEEALSVIPANSESNATELFVGKKVQHKFQTDDGEQWFEGKVISQVHQGLGVKLFILF